MIRKIDAINKLVGGGIGGRGDGTEIEYYGKTPPTDAEIETEWNKMQAEYPMQLLRAERDKKLKEEVDSKTCEAYNNGTQLSNEWKNYRQALLDMTLQTPTLDENGNLKAGLELDEIYWPTKPE